MAGNYPSPTALRINYDLNGTRSWYKTANAASTTLTEDGSFLANMNDESGGTTPVLTLAWNSSTNPGHEPFVWLRFPAPMDITGIAGYGGTGPIGVSASNDTTNGVDGTWTAGSSFTPTTTATIQREWSRSGSITAQSLVNFRNLRLTLPGGSTGNRTLGKVLLFGDHNAASDSVAFWHATLDQAAAVDLFEFGDRARGITTTRQFRIKNRSTVLTAKNVTVTRSIVTDASPSVPGFHTFSLDGSTWTSSVSLGDIAPGAISPVVTLRQVVPTNASLWLWQMRITATPNTWEV